MPGAAMGPAMLRTAGIVHAERPWPRRRGRGRSRSSAFIGPRDRPEGKAHRFAEVAAGRGCLPAKPMRSPARRTPIAWRRSQLAMGSIGGVALLAAEAGAAVRPVADAHSDFNTPLTRPPAICARHVARDAVRANRVSKACLEASRTDSSIPALHCSASGRSTPANGGCCKIAAST